MSHLTNINDVRNEIRFILGEDASDFNIDGIADAAYSFNFDTQTFEPVDDDTFWSIVEANVIF